MRLSVCDKWPKILGRVKKLIEKYTFSLICSGLILLICLIHALSAQYWVDFVPINGTFQNFNPVRRFLDGQVPCRDFSVYLGFGHLLLGSITTFLLGGNYAASLSAFSFLTLLALVLYSFILGKSILYSKKWTKALTVILLVGIHVSFISFDNTSLLGEIVTELKKCLYPGNSARFVRGLAPVLLIYMLYLAKYIFDKTTANKRLTQKQCNLYHLVGYSVICGLFFIYSNDYGIGSWLCFGIILVVVCWARNKSVVQIITAGGIYVLISMVAAVIFVTVLTRGNLMIWLRQTFGTGGYQTWYYLSSHSHYVYDIDFSFVMVLQALIALLYIYEIFKNKGNDWSCQRYGIPAVLNMVAFCVANEYKLLSGSMLHEVAYTILFITIAFEGVLILKMLFKDVQNTMRRVVVFSSILLGGAWCVSSIFEWGIAFSKNDRGIYVAELGGYMSSLGEDLEITKEVLKDKTVFSTYASAIETITDQYQPSQYDYIIHVLGDEAREDYLDDFYKSEVDYVATIREDYTEWEYWIRNANWFFYRELYKNYHPVFSNTYELFWERNAPDEEYHVDAEKVALEIQKINEEQSKIIIRCDESVNGTADVTLTYHLDKTDIFKNNFMWFSCVNVKNTGISENSGFDQFNLPAAGTTEIPISVVNGYGEVTITGEPNGNVQLFLNDAVCNGIFTVNTAPESVISVHEIFE